MGEQETSRTIEDEDQRQDAQQAADAEDGGDEQVEERGADSPESKGEERDFDQEVEDAKKEVKELEEDPPEKLEDWPSGRAKYETFGGPDGASPYDESATAKLGPSDLRHHEDGTVTLGGEKVDDPEEFKGDPIPGGPTDPDAQDIAGEKQGADDEEDADED